MAAHWKIISGNSENQGMGIISLTFGKISLKLSKRSVVCTSSLCMKLILFVNQSYTGIEIHFQPQIFGLTEYHSWHQDIKPKNILVFRTADSPYKWTFKLADLGLSHFKAESATRSDAESLDMFGTKTYGILLHERVYEAM
jgi:hypothetical protein